LRSGSTSAQDRCAYKGGASPGDIGDQEAQAAPPPGTTATECSEQVQAVAQVPMSILHHPAVGYSHRYQ
ncbi:hypothetical protein KI387_030032, partial [Taxus chinensis]